MYRNQEGHQFLHILVFTHFQDLLLYLNVYVSFIDLILLCE